jgi:hypothetical protein
VCDHCRQLAGRAWQPPSIKCSGSCYQVPLATTVLFALSLYACCLWIAATATTAAAAAVRRQLAAC